MIFPLYLRSMILLLVTFNSWGSSFHSLISSSTHLFLSFERIHCRAVSGSRGLKAVLHIHTAIVNLAVKTIGGLAWNTPRCSAPSVLHSTHGHVTLQQGQLGSQCDHLDQVCVCVCASLCVVIKYTGWESCSVLAQCMYLCVCVCAVFCACLCVKCKQLGSTVWLG